MKCNEAEILIMEYFDGGLKKEKLDVLLEHFAECEECELEFNTMRIVLESVENLPELEPEETFTKSVMIEVEKKRWRLRSERYLSSFMWARLLLAFMILTRDFFTSNLNVLTSNPTIASLLHSTGSGGGINTSIISGLGSLFTDLPGKFSALLSKVLYLRTILLSEYLTSVMVLLVTFVLANLGLRRMFIGKEPDRRPV